MMKFSLFSKCMHNYCFSFNGEFDHVNFSKNCVYVYWFMRRQFYY